MYSLDELLCIKVRDLASHSRQDLLESISFWIKRFKEMQEREQDMLMRTRRQNVIDILLEQERVVNFMSNQKVA